MEWLLLLARLGLLASCCNGVGGVADTCSWHLPRSRQGCVKVGALGGLANYANAAPACGLYGPRNVLISSGC